jgi:hypothetical protein
LQALAGYGPRKWLRAVARVMLIPPPSELAPHFERICQFLVPRWPDLVQIRIVVKLFRETAIEEVRLAPDERNT